MQRLFSILALVATFPAGAAERVPQRAVPNVAVSATVGPYVYDAAGNITAIGTDEYVYDSAGRLVSAKVGTTTQTYAYDAFGNRLGSATSDAGATKPCRAATAGAISCDAPLSVDAATNRVSGAAVQYDEAGNMTADGTGPSMRTTR